MDVLNAKEYGQVMWQAYVNETWTQHQWTGLSLQLDLQRRGYPVLNSISMSKYLDAAGTTRPQTRLVRPDHPPD
jgi:hypothetical protein